MKQMGFVLLSGGIDSSTCLGFAVRDCGRENVVAVSIDYGQRHKKELEQAKKVAEYLLGNSDQHQILTIEGMAVGGLTDDKLVIPDVSYAELTGVSPTYVPFRNGQLISKIAAFASARIKVVNDWVQSKAERNGQVTTQDDLFEGRIYFGAHAEDAAGDAYPDCRLDFVGAMAAAVYIGTYHQVRLKAPLIEMYKNEIVEAGQKLGVPWHLTWSCYKGEELHCGICPTCRARKAGFAKAKVLDPTEYTDSDGHIPF